MIKKAYALLIMLGIIANIALIGKERKPIKPIDVIANIIIMLPLAYILFTD